MGRTIPSFRIAAERELAGWKRFRGALSREERRLFDGMTGSARLYTSASSASLRTSPFEALAMALVFHHHRTLQAPKDGDSGLSDDRKVRELIDGWSDFARVLREKDREVFNRMMERCLGYAGAIEAMGPHSDSDALIMSILLEQEKAIDGLRNGRVAATADDGMEEEEGGDR